VGEYEAMRLSKPVYESLPAVYAAIGAAAIAIAYFEPMTIRSVIAFVIGLAAAIAGLTVFLHRQDRRALRREYGGETIDLHSPL
jgi:hypothetical protein